jgi:hypothetical protein
MTAIRPSKKSMEPTMIISQPRSPEPLEEQAVPQTAIAHGR